MTVICSHWSLYKSQANLCNFLPNRRQRTVQCNTMPILRLKFVKKYFLHTNQVHLPPSPWSCQRNRIHPERWECKDDNWKSALIFYASLPCHCRWSSCSRSACHCSSCFLSSLSCSTWGHLVVLLVCNNLH